jgi:hypothetical protein
MRFSPATSATSPAVGLKPTLYMGSETTRKFRMARIRVLTALKIRQNLKPGMYADGLGLYLKVRDGNAKSWIFRYRTGGKLRDRRPRIQN